MKLSDEVEIATRTVRRVKEEMVRRAKGRVDLETTIMCYRGEEPIAIVTLPPDRDALLQVAAIAARGFSPDIMSVTHDSYIASGPMDEVLDPRTGELWQRGPDGVGSMQTYVEEFGFDGTVSECLMTYVLNRAGDDQTVMQPYEVDGREVVWKPVDIPPTAEFGGDIPDALRRAMASATLEQVVPAEAYELVDGDPERARYHMDMATVTVIENKVQLPVVVRLFAKPGSPRDQLFRTRFARSQIVDPSRWN